MAKLTLCLILMLAACNGGGGAAGVCCEVAVDSCASGSTVTDEYCTDELGGVVMAGDCNTDTGKCE